jgi:hypothetical protein
METGKKIFIKPIIIFIVISLVCKLTGDTLNNWKIDPLVLMGANFLLLIMTIILMLVLLEAMKNSNPNVFIRTVMGGTFIKLLILASATLIYIYAAGENRSVYGVVSSLVLYIVYTAVETKIILQLNKKQNATH